MKFTILFSGGMVVAGQARGLQARTTVNLAAEDAIFLT